MLSPDLFSLYSEMILRKNYTPGTIIRRRNLRNIRYADDTGLIAGNEQYIQKLVTTVEEERKVLGSSLNSRNTEAMMTTNSKEILKYTIKIKHKNLKQVEKCMYLGLIATSNGRTEHEVDIRIGQAKTAFIKMKKILTNAKRIH